MRIIDSQESLRYWEENTELYLQHMPTFQAGLFAMRHSEDPFVDNAIEIARRSKLKPGHRILDLGCGVCGPACEIAARIMDVSFVCVTNSKLQFELASERIRARGLNARISLTLGNFDLLEFDGAYDRCVFLESIGYSTDAQSLLEKVGRALKPGGILYIKDVCFLPPLSEIEVRDLEVFNDTYFYNTPSLYLLKEWVTSAGLYLVSDTLLTSELYRDHSSRSMFGNSSDPSNLTEFGKRHYKGFKNLPVEFFELIAMRPVE